MNKKKVILVVAAICSLFPAFAPAAIFATNTCTVGKGPYSVVAADVNGDGKLDLISANYTDNTLTVLTNNGSGNFGSNATLNVGGGPFSVIAADINGSGKPALICANSYANTLTVLTNNGSGNFGSNATLNVGNGPHSVVAADINGSGKLALICANSSIYPNPGTLTVLTNNGSGNFGSNATLNVGSGPVSVIAADINGNGKPALICANSSIYPNPGTLTVLTNNGSGNFGSNATLNVGSGPVSVIAADINGSGRPALICANSYANTLTVLTNNGSGSFNSNATLNVAYPNCVVAADIYGSGHLDLICANSSIYPNPGTLTLWTNNGIGVFGSNATMTVGLVPYSVVAMDVNGGGLVDLVSANSYTNTLTVLTQLISKPPLTIAGNGYDSVKVSWPLLLAGSFALQTNSDLAGMNWGVFNAPIITNGITQSVSVSVMPGNLFFRLAQ